jgi:hypothetical protein
VLSGDQRLDERSTADIGELTSTSHEGKESVKGATGKKTDMMISTMLMMTFCKHPYREYDQAACNTTFASSSSRNRVKRVGDQFRWFAA